MSRFWRVKVLDTDASSLQGRAVLLTIASYASEAAAHAAIKRNASSERWYGARVVYCGPRKRTVVDPPTCHH